MHRKIIDRIVYGITYLFSSFGIITLLAILIFIISNGYKLLSWDLLLGDYYSQIYESYYPDNVGTNQFVTPNIENSYFSPVWGIALADELNKENQAIVKVKYVDVNSPFNQMINSNEDATVTITSNQQIDRIFGKSSDGMLIMMLSSDGAQKMIEGLDNSVSITNMISASIGGGIRGSMITTLYLIVLTLIIALPLGISGAIYLHEFAKDDFFTRIIRNMIDLLNGVPSIIFGLVGAVVFIPFTSSLINSDGGNLLSGSLTLTIILLPIIIKTTEEALIVIPSDYRTASLALGANKTDTVFKIVLPNAIPGILTATILSIGRIIGESAALIYAVGTAIKDDIMINEKSTSLAVHIWSLMSGETPNLQLSCTISIIILFVVFVLSMSVKLLVKKLSKIM